MKPMPPCLNCEKRHTLCHSTCEKYISYKTKLDEYNKLQFEEKIRNRIPKIKKHY